MENKKRCVRISINESMNLFAKLKLECTNYRKCYSKEIFLEYFGGKYFPTLSNYWVLMTAVV